MSFWISKERLNKKYKKRKNNYRECIKISKNGKLITKKEYKKLAKSVTKKPCSEVEYFDTKRGKKYVVLFSNEDLFVTITRENGNKIITSYHFEKEELDVTCRETKELSKEEAKVKISDWIRSKKNEERIFNVRWHKGKR